MPQIEEGHSSLGAVLVIAFCHQAPFSSGPHGGSTVEPQTTDLRTKYMPLFHTNHVGVLFSGHEHLFGSFPVVGERLYTPIRENLTLTAI
jgi:hypothetical protein